MIPNIHINLADGSINIFDGRIVIQQGMSQATADSMLSQFLKGALDHGNGYSWSNFHGLTLGGLPGGLALGFHNSALTQVHLGVALPAVKLEGGWPTRDAIDEEIAFMRKVLGEQLGREFGDRPEHFKWGVAWTGFDAKRFQATAGIRYEEGLAPFGQERTSKKSIGYMKFLPSKKTIILVAVSWMGFMALINYYGRKVILASDAYPIAANQIQKNFSIDAADLTLGLFSPWQFSGGDASGMTEFVLCQGKRCFHVAGEKRMGDWLLKTWEIGKKAV